MINTIERAVIEVFGGCNYTCGMCPQSFPGRGRDFLRKMPLPLFESILDQVVEVGNPAINLEGSGEPTMAKDLPLYVQACTDRNLKPIIYCNGANLNGQYMRDVIDAGMSMIRFSMIGSTQEEYHTRMNVDNFELIKSNIREATSYIEQSGSTCKLATYHLITETDAVAQLDRYKQLVGDLGVTGYVWKMHNWSGNYDNQYKRTGTKRSCGRPFANEITVRAGGVNGHLAAVVPCCQVLGPPREQDSVLGHLDSQTLVEVLNGDLLNDLQQKHRAEDFDSVSYCKDCDFLYDDPETMVWTNDLNHEKGQMLGTSVKVKT